LPRPHFAQIAPQFDELGVALRLLALLLGQNLVNFGQDEYRATAIELRGGGFLVIKLGMVRWAEPVWSRTGSARKS
jgi:hypothetical protein